jgi:hypothetical protein
MLAVNVTACPAVAGFALEASDTAGVCFGFTVWFRGAEPALR